MGSIVPFSTHPHSRHCPYPFLSFHSHHYLFLFKTPPLLLDISFVLSKSFIFFFMFIIMRLLYTLFFPFHFFFHSFLLLFLFSLSLSLYHILCCYLQIYIINKILNTKYVSTSRATERIAKSHPL